jgi:SHS2 domain-containing protein
MAECSYEELEHTSEIGIRVHAENPGALFACAAEAMFALLQIEPDLHSAALSHRIVLDSADAECLMVDWLGELLYLHETTGAVITSCRVDDWSPTHLEADATGYQPSEPPSLHIKAVTFHQLSVTQTDAGWIAVVFFDI